MSAADHLLKAVRETLSGASKHKRAAAEVAVLLGAFEKLQAATAEARERGERMRRRLEERTADAEHVTTLSRTLLARARDVRGAAQAIHEGVEGIRLTALNAGLEGARIADSASAPLMRLADEVRARSVQTLEILSEASGVLTQLDRDRDKLREAAAALGESLGELEAESQQDAATLAELDTLVRDLGEAISRATGADPELAPLLAQAAEHARGLAAALSQLASRDGARLAMRSLQPLLDPLIGVLHDVYGDKDEER